VGVVSPMALCLHGSKIIPDFKGSLSATLADALRRRGERVRIVNLGDVLSDALGTSDQYNPLCIFADNFWREGALQDVVDDAAELGFQLLPEKDGVSQENRYFRDGARDFLAFAVMMSVLVMGYKATLGDAAQMLNDREALLQNALWAAGRLEVETADGQTVFEEMPLEDSPWIDRHETQDILNFKTYLKGLASGIADLVLTADSRTAEAFLTGAQQALARFHITGRAHKTTSETTFRFSELKERPTTVFLVADASRINAQKDVLGLLQWAAMLELKRHPKKDAKVTFLIDEATNFYISDLGSLLTWGRGFGIRIHIILQTLSAFLETYSKSILETLLNVAEVIQFLPGQSEIRTLELIEKLLGEQSVMAESQNSEGAFSGVGSSNFSETAKLLMSKDEIRRCKKTILFLGQNRPMLVDLPPVAAIAPFRKQIDIDPYHGKPFLRPVKLRLDGRIVQARVLKWWKGRTS